MAGLIENNQTNDGIQILFLVNEITAESTFGLGKKTFGDILNKILAS